MLLSMFQILRLCSAPVSLGMALLTLGCLPLGLARLDSIGLFFYFRGWQTFPVKGQTINILGFVSHIVSVTMT